MVRRYVMLFILLSLLGLPQLASALPRQECVDGSGPAGSVTGPVGDAMKNALAINPNDPNNKANCVSVQEEPGSVSYVSLQTLSIPANGSLVYTSSLVKGLQYRFKVTGTWGWDSNSLHKADASFVTADGWSSVSRVAGGRSLEIADVKQSCVTPAAGCTPATYASNHTYLIDKTADSDGPVKLRIYDDNYADGNSGSLSVEVLRAQKVTYATSFTAPVGVATIPVSQVLLVPTTTVDPAPGVGVIVPEIPVPGTGTLATLKAKPVGNGYCLFINTSQTGDIPSGGVCIPNLVNAGCCFEFPVGVQETKLCPNNSCGFDPSPVTVGPFWLGPYSLPDQLWPTGLGERPFKPGSGIQFTIEWSANRDHLFLAASALGGPSQYSGYLPYDFTNPSEVNWYLANRDSVSAKINMAILFPDGTFGGAKDGQPDPSYILPDGITVPGLGQFIEAAFSSKVAGN